MNVQRHIVFHKHYFMDFYLEQTEKVQEKIDYVFKIIRTVQNVPKKFLEYMIGTDGLYEIRIEFEGNIYRIFCCFDKNRLGYCLMVFTKRHRKHLKMKLIWH